MVNKTTKFRFTDRAIAKLAAQSANAPAKAAEYTDSEIPGLKVEVSKTGRKVFRLRYVYRGARRNYKLGVYPATDVAAARSRALEALALLDRDKDPQDERNRIRAMPTFAEFASQTYLPWAQRKRSYRADESKLRLHLVPRFGHRRIDGIGVQDIDIYHGEVKVSHCAATANRHRALLSKMFSLAVDYGLIAENPCRRVRLFKENNQVQRILTKDELGRLMVAIEAELNRTTARAATRVAATVIKFLLFTGVRRQEALEARWEHVDLEAGTLFLPNTKNGKGRHALLNDEARALLSEQPSLGQSPWVFPGRDPEKPLVNPTKAFKRILDAAGIEGRVRLHDARHNAATIAINAGASLYAVSRLLGHSSVSITTRYAHLGDAEQRQVAQSVGSAIRAAESA
ncbi:tyrosine-type recombinase/integrase [Alkalilimnicola sp. S0819]|uniref:tyrosine-type recombinase/integrase n=1 Tax=Alkalilimnicola sp. S0819 TaxID=2613922 RepID=UPI001261B21D|nr:site-specific integrase [Alkalilimnicola sp. S0819]KAB7623404.1 tyrosine-type recombinase/integrase [Alkalilimnicola sp. S0819]MPQ16950.1 tyrosine-type recombinase/integrase [Alkalilimnicola sp. S0819]